jgi:hypothetical protein
MLGMTISNWLILIALDLVWVIPLWVLLKRVGYNPVWALLALIPPFMLVLVWVLAFAPWRTAPAD